MKPKVGLALGSGSAKGFAHVGVIKVLREENIPIDLIVGSSIGAIIGTIYGAGCDVDRLYQVTKLLKQKYYLDFVVPKMGFIAGNRAKDLIRMVTYGKRLEELDIPVGVVTTDLLMAERVVFTEGPIDVAVRASMSIPGIFVPEKVGDRLLVDGGVIDKIPVSVARDLGADIVIGVDVSGIKLNQPVNSVFDVILQCIDIMQYESIKDRGITSDVMIRPPVEKYNSRSVSNIEEIIKVGEEETRKHVDEIKELIRDWQKEKE